MSRQIVLLFYVLSLVLLSGFAKSKRVIERAGDRFRSSRSNESSSENSRRSASPPCSNCNADRENEEIKIPDREADTGETPIPSEPRGDFFESLQRRSQSYGNPGVNKSFKTSRLSGVNNVREVLPGFIYRGGSGGKEDYQSFSYEALQNLCKEGFSQAIDVRGTKSKVKPGPIHCKKADGSSHTLYYDVAIFSRPDAYLDLIHKRLSSQKDPGPIMLHCTGGEHRSGYASAAVLMQFCGYSTGQAQQYWLKNRIHDNWDSSFMEKIRDFPRNHYKDSRQLSPEVRQKVCPQ
ncbi:protein-tyrosine phosphatase family protein [Bdellovibrio reynosensis]|uniref:Tyrosine-protein phosphatase n=1 Tax=Bdellovibrio reynosensis TaxID=2835041 RepID=A0ABY4C697_9BACT|nr:tyrosine-protein phosphatase [Bdellovibrio reynosensis]UOF00502.1 tyrosine-protein phosphatase [Bdellovibrio reynosensis]